LYGRQRYRLEADATEGSAIYLPFTVPYLAFTSISSMPPRKKLTATTKIMGVFAVLGSDEGETKRRANELAIELTPEQGAEFGVDQIRTGSAGNICSACRYR
jgi:hypothetical protein